MDSSPDDFTRVADRLFFTATQAAYGRELWSSSGEPGAPLSVVDIYPGTGSSSPDQLTVGADGALYLLATPPEGGRALLRSDGTAAGTVSLHSGFSDGTEQGRRVVLSPIGPALVAYFEGGAGASNSSEVWATDGTPAGTVLLPGGGASAFAEQGFVRAGNLGYYVTRVNSPASIELWVTDGTVAGSHAVTTLGTGSSLTRFGFVGALGAQAFYTIAEGTGTALWATDGTAAGTRRLLLLPGYNAVGASQSTTFLGKLFFTVWSASGTREIWQSDGTTAGTRAVLTNANAGLPSTIYSLTVSGTDHNRLFFAAYSASSNNQIWVTDGSPAGTVMLQGIGLASAQLPFGVFGLPNEIIRDFDGRAVFSSTQAVYASDGTVAGTVVLAQSQSITPSSVRLINGRVYFASSAPSGAIGVEVYRTVPATQSTELVHDVAPAEWIDGAPTLLDSAGDLLFFAAVPSNNGYYRSDGTETGTFRLASIDVVSLPPPSPVYAGSATVFRGTTAATGREVFRTDGTSAGTGVLVDLNPGTGSSSPSPLVHLGGNGIFGASAGVYRTDGTPQGTQYLGVGTQVSILIPVADRVYCKAFSGIWSTDGTAAGTMQLPNFPASGFPLAATESYLLAQSSNTSPFTLHRLTDTSNPQQLVSTTFSSISSTGAASATIGNVIVFVAWPTGGNVSLWRTDGTPSGTYALTTEALPSDTRILAQIGNLVLFPRDTGGIGAELWATDGTVEGTYLVKDIFPGAVPSRPRGLTALNGRVYFFAESPGAGPEPWVTDGTTSGTHALGEVYPGPGGAVRGVPIADQRPLFAGLGHHVYFLADDGVNGTQLRAVFVCPADFNSDGTLDPDDLSDFIGAFFADPAGPGSDFNADGTTDPDDLSDYITAFFAGCA